LKKIKLISLFILMILIISGCSKDINVERLNFPLLDNMKLEDSVNNVVDKTNVETTSYSVENASIDTFLNDYEKTLNDDGWETISDMKPNGLSVKKNNQKVTLLAYERSNILYVDVIPVVEE